ncbi:NIP100 [[Candida] subhashii]|uniref:NIP100 n=1 Tax=[Candida] subhashii TaxID=561895 RepID=A0A8J5QSW0_9ASCO|nr:NIP100 [[Candida] subhashii]KAG7665768.1 NIP100 [[Candida] subhashii]
MGLQIGDKVTVRNENGIIRYIGNTQFAPGLWYGIELDLPRGKNDGSIDGVRYFDCHNTSSGGGNYGIFVREHFITTAIVTTETTRNENRPISNESRLHKIIEKLQTKLRQLTEASVEYRQQLHNVNNQLKEKIGIVNSLEIKLEMQTTDNDYLRSAKDQLEEKLQDLTIKYQELQRDFLLVSEELEINQQLEHEISILEIDEYTDDDVKNLILRNREIEETLNSFKQQAEINESNLREEIKQLKENQIDESKLKDLETQLEESRATIRVLQERIDAFAVLEKVTDSLTVENEELTRNIQSLQQTLDERSELHELEREVQDQVEIDLRSEIQILQETITIDKASIADLEMRNNDIRNKLESFRQKNQQDDDSVKTEYENQLQSLQKEIKDSTVRNRINSVELELLKGRYKLLISRFKGPKIDESLSPIVELIYLLRMNIVDLQSLETFIYQDSAPQLFISYCLQTLKHWFTFLENLMEYNYESANFISIIENYTTSMDELLQQTIQTIKENDFRESITPETIVLFNSLIDISETYQAIHSNTLICENVLVLRFIASQMFLENNTLSSLVTRLEQSLVESSVNEDIVILQQLLTRMRGEIQQLHDSSLGILPGKDISFTSTPPAFLEVFNEGVENAKVLYHLATSPVDFHQLSDESRADIRSIVKRLESREMGYEYCEIESDFKSICYADISLTKSQPKDDEQQVNTAELAKLISELKSSILQKDTEINDLKLHKDILEQNMKTLSQSNVQTLSQLNAELDSQKDKIEGYLNKISEIEQEKEQLSAQLSTLQNSNEMLKFTEAFTDLDSQNKHNKNLSLLEEVVGLRRLVQVGFSQKDTSEDYGWLQGKCDSGNGHWATPSEFKELSRRMRNIAMHAKTVCIDTGNTKKWVPSKSTPRFIHLELQEVFGKYEAERNRLLS